MNQLIVEKQQNLIKVLLTYPTQASKVLNDNQKLIDHNFVELIEDKSIRVMSYGNHQAANFLKDLANQIKLHFLSEVLPVDEQTTIAKKSSINWENELQKFNLRAQDIYSKENIESHNEPENEEIYQRYKWLPFFILTVSLILASGCLFWYKVSGYRLLETHRGSDYTIFVSK